MAWSTIASWCCSMKSANPPPMPFIQSGSSTASYAIIGQPPGGRSWRSVAPRGAVHVEDLGPVRDAQVEFFRQLRRRLPVAHFQVPQRLSRVVAGDDALPVPDQRFGVAHLGKHQLDHEGVDFLPHVQAHHHELQARDRSERRFQFLFASFERHGGHWKPRSGGVAWVTRSMLASPGRPARPAWRFSLWWAPCQQCASDGTVKVPEGSGDQRALAARAARNSTMAGDTHSRTAGNSTATQMNSGTADVWNPMCQSPCTALGQDRITSQASAMIGAMSSTLWMCCSTGRMTRRRRNAIRVSM